MPNLLGIIQGIANSVGEQVGGAITSTLSYIVNAVNKDVVLPVTSGISGVLGNIESSVVALESAASTGINNTLSAASKGIDSVVANVSTGFTNAITSVEGGLKAIASESEQVFTAVVHGVENGFSAVASAVGQAIQQTAVLVEKGLEEAGSILAKSVADIFTPVAKFLEALPEDIVTVATKVVTGVADVAIEVSKIALAAEKFVSKTLPEEELKLLEGASVAVWKKAFEPIAHEAVKLIGEAAGIKITPDFAVGLGRIAAIAAAENAIGGLEEFFPGAAFIMAALLNHTADAIAVGDFRALEQSGNAGSPNMVHELGELVKGRYRGIVKDDQFYDEFARQGYDTEHADAIFKNAEQLMGLSDLVVLYKRGAISTIEELQARAKRVTVSPELVDDALILFKKLLGAGEAIEMWRRDILPDGWATPFDDLDREGFTTERIDALKKLSITLPSIFQYQDFVARKVDDEEHVRKFDLDFGINQEYFDLARAHGYDEKTARRMYRMYWELPPFFAIVNEYKNSKITEPDFRDAMSFLRFTPHWQDVFVNNLKPALTQGDIKDQYKFKLIKADDIVPALKGIGINDTLAQQLSELWQASVKQANPQDQTSSQVDAAALKGETEGLIKTAYMDRIMTREEALAQLKLLGKGDEAALLIVEIADYELQQKNLKEEFALVKDEYLAGSIDVNEATNRLTAAGANTSQLLLYLDSLNKAGSSKPKTPTLAEFVAWHKKGIIDDAQLASALSLLGYSSSWIPFYLLNAGISQQVVQALGYDIAIPSIQ